MDHVEEYRKPKDHGDEDDLTKKLRAEGCAPKIESSPEPEEDLLPIKPKKGIHPLFLRFLAHLSTKCSR